MHYNESVAEKAFLLRFTFCVKTEECNDLTGGEQRAGMELEELKKLCDLQRSGCCEAKIRLLRKCRCRLLEQIHQKQQALDRLDYLIYRMKNPKE